MKYYILYIPGLGNYDRARASALKMWRVFGVSVQLVSVKWHDGRTYEEKLAEVQKEAEKAIKAGYKVVMIGESAGASLALNAAATLPKLHKIVLIAGVNSSRLPISPYTKKRSIAFAQSAAGIAKSLEKIDTVKIHTIRALHDAVVSPRFNDIPGAHRHVLPTIGHLATIILCLTILSPFVIRIIKAS